MASGFTSSQVEKAKEAISILLCILHSDQSVSSSNQSSDPSVVSSSNPPAAKPYKSHPVTVRQVGQPHSIPKSALINSLMIQTLRLPVPKEFEIFFLCIVV